MRTALVPPLQQMPDEHFETAFEFAHVPFAQAVDLLCHTLRVNRLPLAVPGQPGRGLGPRKEISFIQLYVRARRSSLGERSASFSVSFRTSASHAAK